MYAPISITPPTTSLSIDDEPTTSKDKMMDMPSSDTLAPDLTPMSPGSLYNNSFSYTTSTSVSFNSSSSVCTPNAPSHGLSASVVSTSTVGLSKMFPYDHCSSGGIPMSSENLAAAEGYAPPVVTPISPPVPSTCNTMMVLMRVFPEHKPLMLQAILGEK